ncbi:uncharacterized protein N0V89_012120 [Didymosphaeria variabile]|uniref:F-box domain-containing protein n=1 Tax=Didymosphaeria variabile TaxID=1932322 RepID=A0A9W8XA01_9PLEO|nr:uncharacterized protein N0V89_012120 [Didymosphaeria variabile]KAJ4344380.1 hypothetical protein N0V89_012120 [Didymosphaeria variabile]
MANRSISTLVNIPTELVEHIATYLEIKELCNLRLVCRKLVGDVNEAYAATVFPRLPIFVNSDDSLDRAIAVIKHSAFGKVVCKVSLYIEDFENLELSKGESRIEQNIQEGAWQEPDTDEETSFGDDGNGDVLSEGFSEIERSRLTRLTTLFSCLRESRKFQEVQFTDLADSESCPIIPGGIDKAQLKTPNPRDIRCLTRVLRAMRNAHLSVPKLSLMPERWAFSSRIAGRPPLLGLFKSALQEVEELQLHCWLLSNPNGPSYASKFMAAVASAPKLKSLTFRNVQPWDSVMKGQKTQRLTESQPMFAILEQNYPNLETLRLKSGMIGSHINILRNFIRRQERLEKLVLEDVRCCFWRFDQARRPGETEEGLTRRYFQMPGMYRVIELASLAVRVDFAWTKDGEKTL